MQKPITAGLGAAQELLGAPVGGAVVNAVSVDVCRWWMPCLAGHFTARARFSVQRDKRPTLHYCGPDTVRRIRFYQRNNRQIIVSDKAKRLLETVAL